LERPGEKALVTVPAAPYPPAAMPTVDPRIASLFARAPFIQDLGIVPIAAGEGFCEATLVPSERHLQQDGFAHAGVLTTLADHTAGAAAYATVPDDRTVLSVSFTVQLLRPAKGPLRCRAEVLRAGKNLIFAESSVFAGTPEKLVCRMGITLASVPSSVGQTPR
jgi:uncharacterized protein (TIGR00369 family)